MNSTRAISSEKFLKFSPIEFPMFLKFLIYIPMFDQKEMDSWLSIMLLGIDAYFQAEKVNAVSSAISE